MANSQHIEWLREGVEAWNRRREREDFQPDFEGAKFREVSFPNPCGLYALGPYFEKANFRNAIFKKADLTNAIFNDADLTGDNLYKADLRKASSPVPISTRSTSAGST